MFPRQPVETYSDLYEEVASKHYSLESVFGPSATTETPRHQPSFQQSRSSGPGRKRAEPNFTVEVKKSRKFTRPGEEPAKLPSTDPNSLFKPRF